MVAEWIRRLRAGAVVLVGAGIVLILAGGDQRAAQGLLVAGIVYAVTSVILERRARR